MSDVRLLCGDCLEILPTLEAGSIDAVLTDLPYGITHNLWDKVIPFEPMWEQVKRVLKPHGVFATTAGQPFISALVMSNPEWFRYEWVWNKAYCTGHLWAKQMPMKQHDNVAVFFTGAGTYNPQMEQLKAGDSRFRASGRFSAEPKTDTYRRGLKSTHHAETGQRYPKSIIRFLQPRHLVVHPTQKPTDLYEYLVRTYTNEGETVLDFVMGSGTTGVACVQTGRNFVGIEISPHDFANAERRIAEAQLQMRMPL